MDIYNIKPDWRRNYWNVFCKIFAKKNQKEFRISKILKKKVINLFAKGEGYDNPFNSLTDKKASLYAMSYLPGPYTRS